MVMVAHGHVFISYAREDGDFAREIIQRLRKSDIVAWQDVKELRGGDGWQDRIDDALSDAKALIVVMSPAATKSQYVTYEWAFALGAGVRVIPVLRKTAELHPRLSSLQYVDFRPGRVRNPWVRLLNSLPNAPEPPRLDGPPTITAKFDLTNGEPSRTKSGEYVIWLSIEHLPRKVTKVVYEAHDDSFDIPQWTEDNPADQFNTWMHSDGDVLVTAVVYTARKQLPRTGTTLLDALRKTHGRSRNPAIKKALRDIEIN